MLAEPFFAADKDFVLTEGNREPLTKKGASSLSAFVSSSSRFWADVRSNSSSAP